VATSPVPGQATSHGQGAWRSASLHLRQQVAHGRVIKRSFDSFGSRNHPITNIVISMLALASPR
jgi:hypothetical protein